MTRKERLAAIPFPAQFGDSDERRRDFALALEVAEHWETNPKTREEQEKMSESLPRHLKWKTENLLQGMMTYVFAELAKTEPVDVATIDSPKPADDKPPF